MQSGSQIRGNFPSLSSQYMSKHPIISAKTNVGKVLGHVVAQPLIHTCQLTGLEIIELILHMMFMALHNVQSVLP